MINRRDKDEKSEIRIIDLNLGEMKKLISEILEEKLGPILSQVNSAQPYDEKFWTRKETAARLSITLPTLNEWTKSGKLKSYKIGRRILYKPNEVSKDLKLQAPILRK